MKRSYSWPEGHWGWPIKVTHKHGVRCGNMLWIGGQVDFSPEGGVLNPGDLWTQIGPCLDNFASVLQDLGGELSDIVHLNCFYVNDGGISEEAFIANIADFLPEDSKVAITPIALPYLAYDGMMLEIEGVAMRGQHGGKLDHMVSASCNGGKIHAAVRCGKMIFVSAKTPLDANGDSLNCADAEEQIQQTLQRIEDEIAVYGADLTDVVKLDSWYTAAGHTSADSLANAYRRSTPNAVVPATTSTPVPRHADPTVAIKISAIAMLGEDGEHLPQYRAKLPSREKWPSGLPSRHGIKCGEMIFISGQVSLDKSGAVSHPHDLSTQTYEAMAEVREVLQALDADFDDACKVLTHYKGDCGAHALHENLPIRSSHFTDPGPATTGVPLPVLERDGLAVAIQLYAMLAPD